MENNGSPGMNRLARVMSERMRKEAGKAPRDLDIDFGVINKDYSLLTNTFPIPIPKNEYHVCRHLTLGMTGEKLTTTKSDGEHGGHLSGNGQHSHTVVIPEKMCKIKPGDRVLVAWVQNEAVVIDVVQKI